MKVVQLHADILNLPINLCDEKEAGCRGAAMLAQKAVEGRITIPTPAITGSVAPDKNKAAQYEKKFEDGTSEIRRAYEVSVSKMEIEKSAENNDYNLEEQKA